MDDLITEDVSPAEEAPAEGPETYAEVAKEIYGDKFVDEAEEPDEPEQTEDPEFFESAEEAAKYFIDEHRAAERIDQDLAREVPAPAPLQTEAEPVTDAVWSNEDVANLQAYNQAVQVYQNDLHDVAEIKNQVNQSGLERTDRERAVAYRVQIREAEKELAQRHQTLSGMQDEFNGKAEKHTLAQGQNMVTAEQAKLMAAAPDFDKTRVSTYLEKTGFTQDEMSELTDHRMAITAHKAMLYDELMDGKGPKKVPKLRKKGPGAPNQTTSEVLFGKLARTGRMDDAVAALTARRREGSEKPVPKAVQNRKIAALKAKAEKTHSFDDVVAYHTARSRRAKQAGAAR